MMPMTITIEEAKFNNFVPFAKKFYLLSECLIKAGNLTEWYLT